MASTGKKCLSLRICQRMGGLLWRLGFYPRLGMSILPVPHRNSRVQIFPVSLFCALTSLTNIAGFIKPLQNFLNAHPKAASAITSLAPVIFVALLTICICPILLLIANKAETINTKLGVHNSVLERFWKFLMVNGVVFFAVGQTAIEAYLTAFQTNDFDPLPIVASSFASNF